MSNDNKNHEIEVDDNLNNEEYMSEYICFTCGIELDPNNPAGFLLGCGHFYFCSKLCYSKHPSSICAYCLLDARYDYLEDSKGEKRNLEMFDVIKVFIEDGKTRSHKYSNIKNKIAYDIYHKSFDIGRQLKN